MGRGLDLTPSAPPGSGPLEAVAHWPVGSATAGVLRGPMGAPGAPARSETVALVGDLDAPYAWASVTKVLVALAVLVASEEGTLGLDDRAGPPGATVRHLLAHASGLGPDAEEPIAAPGRRRIYSNVGYEVLARTVAQRAGMAFSDYLRAGVLDPLAMMATDLAPGASPASGAHGPGRDLLALAGELLAPRLVDPSTLAGATAVAFGGLPGVLPGFGRYDPCDWGLGVEVRGSKAPHWTGTRNSTATFGHFGQAGGFVWVDPEAGLAVASLSDRDFGPWARTAWPALSDAVLGRWAPPPHPGPQAGVA